MVEFKTQYGMVDIDPKEVINVIMDGNLTLVSAHNGSGVRIDYIVSDSYSEAMRKLGRMPNV